jgi:hypothetical protein
MLADAGCARVYSLNRDRSPHNTELSTVTEILATRYRVEAVDVLPESYNRLDAKIGKKKDPTVNAYRHSLARLR